jgi:hypothetical protein
MSNYPYSSGSGDSSTREVMIKNATQGGFALGGGVALLIFKGIAGIPFVGPIVGGAMLIAGLVMRGKGSTGDKLSSLALIGLGAVSVATIIPGIGGLASFLMGASAIGLIGFGAWKLWQYYKGMKARG